MKTTRLLAAAALASLALATPSDAERIKARRVSRLPEDTIALSRLVMQRMTDSLLQKDLRRILALQSPRGAAPSRPVLQREPLLDAGPGVRDTLLNGRIPIPAGTPIERASFTETFSGTGTFDNSALTFSGTGTGSRSGFRPGNLTGTLTGQIAIPDAQQRADFIASNPGSSTGGFSATAVGEGFRMGDGLISGNTSLAVSGVARGNLPGTVSIPLSSSNFRIDDRGASAGDFSAQVAVPGVSDGRPTIIGGTIGAQYGTQPR